MNPVIFNIGAFELRWYSVLILVAILMSYIMVKSQAKKFGIKEDFIFNMGFWIVVLGIIGARAYYVVFNFDLFKNNLIDIIKIWEGGLAIHGAILGGLIAILIYAKKYNLRILRYTDFIVVPLILAQAIGRWGNFFNSEAHGAATTLKHLESLHIPDFIIKGMQINGIYYTPTFLYESIWCIIGFIILLIIRRSKYIKVGELTAIYFMWYSVGRFIIESSRTDSLMFLGFKVAQIISIVLFIVGLIIIIVQKRKSKFEDLYNDQSNVDVVRF